VVAAFLQKRLTHQAATTAMLVNAGTAVGHPTQQKATWHRVHHVLPNMAAPAHNTRLHQQEPASVPSKFTGAVKALNPGATHATQHTQVLSPCC
jgi:hypothetical protein